MVSSSIIVAENRIPISDEADCDSFRVTVQGRSFPVFKRRLPDGSRSANYYTKFQVGGKITFHSLGTPVKHLAVRAAKAKAAAALDGRWDALEDSRLREAERSATIGEVLAAYLAAAQGRLGLKARTAANNAGALRLLVARSGGCAGAGEADGVSADALTRAAVFRFQEAARNAGSGNSMLAQARSVFSKRAREVYRDAGLRLPEALGEFMAVPRARVRADHSFRPLGRKAMEEIERSSREAGGALRAVFLMAYRLGMRAGEIEAARRDWIEEWPDGPKMALVEREGWRPKGREGRVPMTVETRDELLALAGPEHLVPGETKTDRATAVRREACAWLRRWMPDRRKAVHELRKQAGSAIATRDGLMAARDWLRHKSIKTTEQHYAALLAPLKPL